MSESTKSIGSRWEPETGLLVTRLRGLIDENDVRQWVESLRRPLAEIPDGARFKIIVDLRDYEPRSIAAHKSMRDVIPLTLADHGFRTALLDLFDPIELPVKRTRGITCVATANVHHDAGKMAEYDQRIGRNNERFFSDYEQARDWLLAITPIPFPSGPL